MFLFTYFILILYALLLSLVPAPGLQAGTYIAGQNLVSYIDIEVLGRTHPEGWGTVLSTIPTISTTILGLLIGRILKEDFPKRKKLQIIALTGLSCLIAGLLLDPVVPVIMKLWTTSYGLASAGWSCLLFLIFYWLIDVRGFKRWAFPFIVIGMNALAVYMGRTLLPLGKIVGIYSGWIAGHIGMFGMLFEAAAVLMVEWLILYWLYKKKIFLIA